MQVIFKIRSHNYFVGTASMVFKIRTEKCVLEMITLLHYLWIIINSSSPHQILLELMNLCSTDIRLRLRRWIPCWWVISLDNKWILFSKKWPILKHLVRMVCPSFLSTLLARYWGGCYNSYPILSKFRQDTARFCITLLLPLFLRLNVLKEFMNFIL